MTQLLENRVALVTGASRGIGAATAKMLARHGAAVAVNYVSRADAAERVVNEIRAAGGRAALVQADATNEAQVRAMATAVESELGDIDIAVLNAGMPVHMAPALGYPWAEFEKKLVGESRAVFYAVQAIAPGMVTRQRGSIIVVSSGLSRRPGHGFCAHSASKAALDGYVRSLALELGPHGVRVNTVAPGLVRTDATANLPDAARAASANAAALKRVGEPDDIAGAILMLASDAARHITGTYLPVDGGSNML